MSSVASQAKMTKRPSLLQRLSETLLPELERYMLNHRQRLDAMSSNGDVVSGSELGVACASAMDGLFCSLFHATRGALQQEGLWHDVAIGAVGSYGRRVLTPSSDLDVHIVCDHMSRATPVVEAMLYPLWHVGLNIGHQIVTPKETLQLALSDLPTATALLDWRHLVGNARMAQALHDDAARIVFGPQQITSFLDRLETSALKRHERYGGSVYLLEPDVKNGAGGLRDMDIALWAAKARWGVSELAELVERGVLLAGEWERLKTAFEFLTTVRAALHRASNRKSDRLGFDRQEALASSFGHGTGGRGVEEFMSRYYRAAQLIEQSRQMIIQRAVPPPKRRPSEVLLGRGLKRIGEELGLESSVVLQRDPAVAVRIYYEAVIRRDLKVHPSARQAIMKACSDADFCERLRRDDEAAQCFVHLISTRRRTKLKQGSVLPELHEVGLLLAMIPEFRPVVGRVHHDVYHVYTVDAHSIAAVGRLRALCRGDHAEEFPLACRLAAEIARPTVLFLALLLHDIGKDLGGQQHPERGAELARDILQRLGVAQSDIAEVQHLIAKHLRMYHVATRRDIDDPRTIETFCSEVHGREGLRELYLLTIADVSTTSPTSMTSWKSRMLDDLYVAAHHHLSTGSRRRSATRLHAAFERAKQSLAPEIDEQFLSELLSCLPERYLYANDTDQIAGHLKLVRDAGAGVKIGVLNVNEPYVELGIVAGDRPGLLSLMAAAMSASKFKVLGAQIYSWKAPDGSMRALDMFWVRRGMESQGALRHLPEVQKNLEALLAGTIDPKQLIGGGSEPKWTGGPRPAVASRVTVDPRAGSQHTIIEVITRDRPDLLFWLSSAIHEAGCFIDLAKINTEGDRVADVFYVTNEDGSKVTDRVKLERLDKAIRATLASLEGRNGS